MIARGSGARSNGASKRHTILRRGENRAFQFCAHQRDGSETTSGRSLTDHETPDDSFAGRMEFGQLGHRGLLQEGAFS